MHHDGESEKVKRCGLPDPDAPIVQKVFNEPSGSLVLVVGQSTLGAPRTHRLYVRTIDDDLYREVHGLGGKVTIHDIISSRQRPELYTNIFVPSDRPRPRRVTVRHPDGRVEERPISSVECGYNWKAVFVVPLPQGMPREIPVTIDSPSPEERVWISELKSLENEGSLLVKYARQRRATAEETARIEWKTTQPRRIEIAQTVDYFLGFLNSESGVLTEIEKLDSPFGDRG